MTYLKKFIVTNLEGRRLAWNFQVKKDDSTSTIVMTSSEIDSVSLILRADGVMTPWHGFLAMEENGSEVKYETKIFFQSM